MFVNDVKKEIFIDVHFEQVYNSMSLNMTYHALLLRDNDNSKENGIYQRRLLKSTVSELSSDLNVKGYKVYFDMEHITKIDQGARRSFKTLFSDLRRHNNEAYVYNVASELVSILNQLIGSNYYKRVNEKSYYGIANRTLFNDDYVNIHTIAREAFDDLLTNRIEACCELCADGISPSSCVKLTKYINIKKLLDNFKDACFLIYKLALKLEEGGVVSISDKLDNEDKVFFLHTMNSTVLGSILAQLFGMDILLVDHLGPYNKLFIDGIEKSIDPAKKYIVVADVVCMGTELNSARTFLNIFGAKYFACASLVDIIPVGLVDPSDQKIFALLTINSKNNPIKYTISTDLIG